MPLMVRSSTGIILKINKINCKFVIYEKIHLQIDVELKN